MARPRKFLLGSILICVLMAAGAAAYGFFVGFPHTFEGHRVHRVTVWAKGRHFQPEIMYYAYRGPDGKEIKHGIFHRFDEGQLVQEATYRNGKIDGTNIFWNLLGAKTQEVYYHQGTPYGWANFAQGKLLNMRQDVSQDGRSVAVKSFDHGRYALEFNCGELINAAIDSVTGQISSFASGTRKTCTQP